MDRRLAQRDVAPPAADFSRAIAPHLAALEATRRACLRKLAWIWLAATGFGALQLAIYWLLLPYPALYVTAIVSAGLLGWVLSAQPGAVYGAAVRDAVMPAICDFVGHLAYKRHCGIAIDPGPLREAGLVDDYNQVTEEDLVEGTHRGRRFRMVEVLLAVVRGKPMRSVDTVFQGVIVTIAPLPGSSWRLRALPIASALLARLAAAAEVRGGKLAAATVLDGALVVLLPLGARFEPGSLFQPAQRMADDMHRTLRDVTLPHRLIDALDDEA